MHLFPQRQQLTTACKSYRPGTERVSKANWLTLFAINRSSDHKKDRWVSANKHRKICRIREETPHLERSILIFWRSTLCFLSRWRRSRSEARNKHAEKMKASRSAILRYKPLLAAGKYSKTAPCCKFLYESASIKGVVLIPKMTPPLLLIIRMKASSVCQAGQSIRKGGMFFLSKKVWLKNSIGAWVCWEQGGRTPAAEKSVKEDCPARRQPNRWWRVTKTSRRDNDSILRLKRTSRLWAEDPAVPQKHSRWLGVRESDDQVGSIVYKEFGYQLEEQACDDRTYITFAWSFTLSFS